MRCFQSIMLLGALALHPLAARAAHTALSDVRACLPLEGGALALATSGGLVLRGAEGSSPRVLTALDGLPETRVHIVELATAATKSLELWVGTEAGLARVRWAKEEVRVTAVYPSAPVRALLPWRGELLVGTWGGGLLRLGAEQRLIPIPTQGQASPQQITTLAARGETAAVGTAGAGLFVLEGGTLRAHPAELPSPLIWSLAVVGERLFAGTLQGLAVLASRGSTTLTNADARALALADDRLIVATYGEGLLELPLARSRLQPGGPAGASFVHSVTRVRGGASCLAAREGLWVRAPRHARWTKIDLPAGPPSSDLSALAHDGEQLWAGTYDEGLAALRGGQWTTVGSGVLDRRINALVVEGSGPQRVLWVATARGLFALRGAAERPMIRKWSRLDGLPSDDVLALALAPQGLLVGTARGAALIHSSRLSALGRKQGLIISAVWAVAASEDGLLWLGTSKGLFAGRPGGRWRRLSLSTGHLRDDWVTALHWERGLLWVGTYNGGISRLAVNTAHEVTAMPLCPGWVNFGGLSAARGRLYAATMDGLLTCPLDQPTGCELNSTLAPGRDVTAALEAEGQLWVASRRGLVASSLASALPQR